MWVASTSKLIDVCYSHLPYNDYEILANVGSRNYQLPHGISVKLIGKYSRETFQSLVFIGPNWVIIIISTWGLIWRGEIFNRIEVIDYLFMVTEFVYSLFFNNLIDWNSSFGLRVILRIGIRKTFSRVGKVERSSEPFEYNSSIIWI